MSRLLPAVGTVLLLTACGESAPSTAPDVTGGTGGGGGASGASGSGGASGASGSAGTSASGGSGGSGGGAGAVFSCTATADPGETIAIDAGEFVMGCNATVDTSCLADEKPMRNVSLSAFEIDRTEVTQAEYTACVLAKACDPPGCEWNCDATDHPAGCITWDQAKMYCAWANARLPTEAEWEKAARGTDGRKYPWGNFEPTCNEVNMTGCGEQADAVGAHPAGASPYGVLDMGGNMVEMVADWYDASYYASAPDVDPKGPDYGERYVGRGGGYKSKAVWLRASSRDWYDTYDLGKPLGFRCAR